MLTFALLLVSAALAAPVDDYLSWAEALAAEHPEPLPMAPYRSVAQLHGAIAPLVEARPDRVQPVLIGQTVEELPIWGFRVRSHAGGDGWAEEPRKVLVFAGIHPMEWISTEVATAWLTEAAAFPPEGVELIVVPVVNLDRRLDMEEAQREGKDRYYRFNADGTDLNRDFAHNRESDAVWKRLIPARYQVSGAPLSQPETRALDELAEAEDFDVVVSLHAFGGFFYYPWAGRWERIPRQDRQEHVRLGHIMARAQGSHAYKTRQLSHWGFFFRGLGMEVDHFYAEHGATSFLIELTRSGLNPLRPATLRSDFAVYNPENLDWHVEKGVSALRGLVGALAWEVRHGKPWGG